MIRFKPDINCVHTFITSRKGSVCTTVKYLPIRLQIFFYKPMLGLKPGGYANHYQQKEKATHGSSKISETIRIAKPIRQADA